jgi:zinc protease
VIESHLTKRIHTSSSQHGTALVLPWDIDSVVSIRGSFSTSPDFRGGEELTQDFLVGMLDKGTQKRTKLQLAEALENCGASIRFSSAGTRIRFEAKCLKADLNMVLSLINEQLRFPALDASEYELLRQRYLANIQRMDSDTGSRASDALARHVYDPGHPRFARSTAEMLEQVRSASMDEAASFLERQFGANSLVLTVVGDVADQRPEMLLDTLCEGFDTRRLPEYTHDLALDTASQRREHIEIRDRSNLDLRMGHGVQLTKKSPDYLPLFLGVFMLGGNFSSHLMNTIRDRDGLTYGIRSQLSGLTAEYPGAWVTSITLSRDKLETGIEATLAEIKAFIRKNSSEDALELCKTTITGSYKIQLSTTGGIAANLMTNQEEGRPLDRIDLYPDEINRITTTDVDRVMSKYLNAERLFVVSAGTK